MDLIEIIQPGMGKEALDRVEEEHTAAHVGSGSLRVLATPWMIAYMERVARDFLAEHLPEGYTSVGVRVDVQHLAPSLVGSQVRVHARVLTIDGTRVNFSVEAWDGAEQIGVGEHQRAVIDEARFLRRIAAKTGDGEVGSPTRS
jgi:predicted thioesterase